jgi:hypothetical protein
MSPTSRPAPPRRPPPLPRQRAGARPHGCPSMTLRQKDRLTFQAMGILEEQVQTRIVHYKAELETSPELDAVTAQVVAQIKALQAAVAQQPRPARPAAEIETEQIEILASLLERILTPAGVASFATQNLKPVGRRIAKLFFESELHEKSKGDREKVIRHAEQGVFYLLQRYRHRLRAELEGFVYENADIRQLTLEHLERMERDLQDAFLSRCSPELNRVMNVFMTVLTVFLTEHLPPRAPEMAKVSIRNARTARQPNSLPYRVQADRFAEFRTEWERVLTQQMVHYCGDELLARFAFADQPFHEETVKFFIDPHIFSETVRVLSDSLYDFLALEGFLELPVDWRTTHARP